MFKSTLAAGAIALLTLFSSVLPAMAGGPSPAGATSPDQVVAVVPSRTISPAESASLQYMREEEKLAHDVYVTLYGMWGSRVFDNIAASEQKHTDAVLTLLNRYSVSDPAAGNALGEFTDPTLQTLYDQLTAQGAVSVVEALKVGAAIEELDILDLETCMAETTKPDILRVYGNLLAGSENHLRAFTANLTNLTGTPYMPQYLDPEVYEEIISSAGAGQLLYMPSVTR
jgi:hypothetical protein